MEYSISYRKNFNFGEENSLPSNEGIIPGTSKTKSYTDTGIVWFGQIHTHPKGTDPMFSWSDVRGLKDLYEGLYEDFTKEDIFIMIVNHDGTVYTIKISDAALLLNKIQEELDNTDGITDKIKEEELNKDIQLKFFEDDNNDLERVFLKKFRGYGISLYKANDQNLSNWSKLELSNANSDSPTVTSIPCL